MKVQVRQKDMLSRSNSEPSVARVIPNVVKVSSICIHNQEHQHKTFCDVLRVP